MADDDTLTDVIDGNLDRRDFLQGAAAVAAGAALPMGSSIARAEQSSSTGNPSSLDFSEPPASITPNLQLAEGYSAEVVVRWGDALHEDDGDVVPTDLDADAQVRRFGYNNDYLAFLPLPFDSRNAERGLLCVNHEYVNPELMFDGVSEDDVYDAVDEDQVATCLASTGHSVVAVRRTESGWKVDRSSKYNRRISTLETEMQLTGPAAGHERLQTDDDPKGTSVVGTLGNCAGGVTPWGTVLVAEENFDDYFGGKPSDSRLARNLEHLGTGETSWYGYEKFRNRFDVGETPGEINKFGWIVEFDPRNPDWTPRKRTALGRFKHEGATTAMNADGRIVLYSGDDEEFEHLYKWVSKEEYDPTDRTSNFSLLEEGTLYVAKFRDDGTVKWLPLVHGHGPLTEENDFRSQADVLIETRRAADMLGATDLDRPEDAEVDGRTGRLYVTLTNNHDRSSENVASPRAPNTHGHVLELIPPYNARRHSADTFQWQPFILGGNPDDSSSHTKYHPETSDRGWITCPDNLTYDREGRIWIATDQGGLTEETGVANGLFGADTVGEGRALTRRLASVPAGAEPTGPYFTPDERTLFLSVQHPGEGSDLSNPSTRWPDFEEDHPPRPAVVAITRDDDKPIGG